MHVARLFAQEIALMQNPRNPRKRMVHQQIIEAMRGWTKLILDLVRKELKN